MIQLVRKPIFINEGEIGLMISAIFDLLKVCLITASVGVILILAMMFIVNKLGAVGFCASLLILFILIIGIINKL